MASNRSLSPLTSLRHRGGRASTSWNTLRESLRICRVKRSSWRYSSLRFSSPSVPLWRKACPIAITRLVTLRIRSRTFRFSPPALCSIFFRSASGRVRHRSASRCRSGSECCSPPPIQLHNAYGFELVTIYYRWHPLFGLSVPVRARRKDRAGERIYCESDGQIYPIPSWMLSPECLQLLLGPPLISAEALCEL